PPPRRGAVRTDRDRRGLAVRRSAQRPRNLGAPAARDPLGSARHAVPTLRDRLGLGGDRGLRVGGGAGRARRATGDADPPGAVPGAAQSVKLSSSAPSEPKSAWTSSPGATGTIGVSDPA